MNQTNAREHDRTEARGTARAWRPDSLASRLVLFAVTLVSGTALTIGSVSYIRARGALEHETQAALNMVARDVADDVSLELSDSLSDLMNWSHLEIMRAVLYHDVDKEIAEFFKGMTRTNRTYLAILCLDLHGAIVAQNGNVEAPAGAVPIDAARLRVAPLNGVPMLLLETPIAHPERPAETIGALVLAIDPTALLGKVAGDVLRDAHASRIALKLADHTTLAELGAHSHEREIVGGAEAVSVGTIALPHLAIEAGKPRASALAAIGTLRSELFTFGLVALIAGSLLGSLMAWRIARPIQRLTRTVGRVSELGTLDGDITLPSASGEVGRLLESFREMMASLRVAQDKAINQSRLALLGEIAANIAHEVRTPLSVMKTSAQLLERSDPAEKARLVRLIGSEVDRLNAVVGDLINIGRPARVAYEVEPLVPIVMRAVALCNASADAAGIAIATDMKDKDVRVRCSGTQLYQAVLNLLRNAMQAIGSSGRIKIRVRRETPSAVIEIDDDGPGFPPELLQKAFSPFVTTKHNGTGLGLAIARRIVLEHGGAISAVNLEGGGARLRIELPLVEARI